MILSIAYFIVCCFIAATLLVLLFGTLGRAITETDDLIRSMSFEQRKAARIKWADRLVIAAVVIFVIALLLSI